MEVRMSAALLRNLLVAHQKAMKLVQAIDIYITDLNRKIFRSSLNGNHSYSHQLTLRSSVAMGIRHVCQQYADKKWKQVQETSRLMIASLEGDAPGELESAPMNHGRVTTMDQAAPQWSTLFNECYRHN